jgi:hypothetical protein
MIVHVILVIAKVSTEVLPISLQSGVELPTDSWGNFIYDKDVSPPPGAFSLVTAQLDAAPVVYIEQVSAQATTKEDGQESKSKTVMNAGPVPSRSKSKSPITACSLTGRSYSLYRQTACFGTRH